METAMDADDPLFIPAFLRPGTPEHAADWRADGLDVVEIEYTIPEWVVAAGLVKPWVFGVDIIKWLKS